MSYSVWQFVYPPKNYLLSKYILQKDKHKYFCLLWASINIKKFLEIAVLELHSAIKFDL